MFGRCNVHASLCRLKYGTKACCGYGGGDYNFDREVFCGNTNVVNGQRVSAGACEDPYNYVSWDGFHLTDAANKVATQAIFSGSSFDPPFPLHNFCDINPLG